jgi:hypothetical protein
MDLFFNIIAFLFLRIMTDFFAVQSEALVRRDRWLQGSDGLFVVGNRIFEEMQV